MDKSNILILTPGSYTSQAITGETIAIPAGVAGTVVDFYFAIKPIGDENGSYIGGNGDTSVALTSTAFTNEVAQKTSDSDMSNGDYWIDYTTGKGRGKKDDNSVSMTADYLIFIP